MNKQLKITSTLFIICSMLATALLAQDTKTISLREAIDLSIKNSKSLKASNARIDEATAIVKEA